MIKLPEKIRKTLEKTVNEMKMKANVYGIGLFGSWSRGDAVTSSDIDLFILDKGEFDYEYVERIAVNGLLIDLNYVPKRWIASVIPTEIDQKLFETQILYDRDWSLTNTKLLMAKSYSSSERVDIRTEVHVIDSDIYLSRATSALSREDFLSAWLFSTVALENMLKVLIEIALEPFSNSRFIEKLEGSTRKLGMQELFSEFLETTKLNNVDHASVSEKLRLFKTIWDETSFVAKQNVKALESSHFKVKTKLKYHLNPAFLQGVVVRAHALADSGKLAEASHYLSGIFVDLIENYVWLKASVEKLRVDITTLMHSLKGLEKRNPRNYANAMEFLSLNEVSKQEVARTIEKTRKVMLKIRRERKNLIKDCFPNSN
jgi:predicted nucleotidyltransferase